MIYKLENVAFSYNKRKIIDIMNLDVEEGRIYALFGANGSGKTTLMKILNGLLKVESGYLYYKNKPIESNNYKLIRKETVYIHQNPLLLTGTVCNNIAYGLKIRKESKENIEKIVQKMLKLVDLSGFENRKSKGLSIGEIKRVAIARALAISPKVILLDEPTAHIDRNSREKIAEILEETKKKFGTTVIFSSHDDTFNKKIADKVIHIENGEIID